MGIFVTVLCVLLVGVLITSYFVQGALTDKAKVSLLDVGQGQYKRNAGVLWVLIVLSVAYGALLRYLRTLTGMTMLDGGIGVALGLYICAHPAANAVNMLFFERHVLRQISSDWATIRWLTLNLLVLLAGWVAIYIGITRLVARTTQVASASIPLNLDGYRSLAYLDERFEPPSPAPETKAEQIALVDELLAHLRSERDGIDVNAVSPSYDEKRRLLRALLTVRDPAPLPDWFHAQMDRLLQREAHERGLTDAAALPRVAQEVELFLDGLTALKDECPDDASFINHIRRRTEAWAPGLFSCYEEPTIPRTNNDLEQYNSILKRQQRRITGRKTTADFVTRHGPYVVFFDPHESDEQVLVRFRHVPATAFREERKRFVDAQACQRRIRSFRRDADRFL